jgi:D-cysteine desulfhydrase family pyridoxal phosphate-dependent enzyme
MVNSVEPEKLSLQELQDKINKIPRITIGHIPTPLDACPNLTRALGGPKIFMKRDDCTGLAFGGNKTRQLEFIMADVINSGADIVVAGAASQSNLCRQTAAAARKLGLKASLVLLSGIKGSLKQGNLLLDYMLDAEIEIVESKDFGIVPELLKKKEAELRSRGLNPYVFDPFKESTFLAAVAYVNAFIELDEQMKSLGIKADYLYLSGLNITPAGLALAAKALNSDIKIIGISPAKLPESRPVDIARIANKTAELLNLDTRISPEEIKNYEDYVGKEYGVPTKKGIEALKLVSREEGIMLDPVYTSKAMACLIDHIKEGKVKENETVIFLHTGGTPALFSYPEVLDK